MEGMATVKVQKGQTIVKQKDKVHKWYLILEGTVIQRNSYARVMLGKDAVIGISESDRYLCDYIAAEDCTLAAFPFGNADDLKSAIHGQASIRSTLLRAALNQRQLLLRTYMAFYNLVRQFHSFVENQYNDYTAFCESYHLEEQDFTRMNNFKPLEMVHRAEGWEVNNSASLTGGYLEEYLKLMQKDDSMCIGAIMECCYQTRRVTQGIIEMAEYLSYHKDILLSVSENDIFALYYELLLDARAKNYNLKPLTDNMDRMAEIIKKLGIYEEKLIAARIDAYRSQDFQSPDGVYAEPEATAGEADGMKKEAEAGEDCLMHILSFADCKDEEKQEMRGLIQKYFNLPDVSSTEPEVYGLRKRLTQSFYDVYQRVFLKVVKDESQLTPILEMFLNFGFMDVQMAGEENANILYDLTEHLHVCRSEHVYTIYDWLKSVYQGKNEPSKNEFDMDYPAYLADLKKNGKITQEQQRKLMENNEYKVRYEMQNMFVSGNRVTYGKISTFCPILAEYDLINAIDKMLVTAQKLEAALDKVRAIDYSVFYREVQFSDPDHGINRELIMKEILPDIILMPNAGTRAQMWQETAGVRRDTSARFLFPIFTAVDLEDMMIDTMGRYRWEICRKIQGVRWNDIREKSLTAEYCDYLQFYRKNHDLSQEAKEKIKSALLRGRNNYREVFVKDYQNWIKYESKGSYRLNKVTREIMLSYCPFARSIRQELVTNPMYEGALHRFDISNAKKVQRIQGVYDKYQKAGGVLTQELEENLDYYSL